MPCLSGYDLLKINAVSSTRSPVDSIGSGNVSQK